MVTEAQLAARIEAIKAELASLGELRPGTVSSQYNICGHPKCPCKADPPQKHGPYYQLSYSRQGKSRTEAVHPEDLDQVRSATANYRRLKALVAEWVDSSLELSQLRRADKYRRGFPHPRA